MTKDNKKCINYLIKVMNNKSVKFFQLNEWNPIKVGYFNSIILIRFIK